MREKISACVMTCNEERNIRRCLESIMWCDEIVVVDSFSTDRTIEICREYTDKVLQHEWLGYIGQRNLMRRMAVHPWVLYIDADEEISPKLRDAIVHEFEHRTDRFVGYEFPRQVYYLGKWIRHGAWYPDFKLRLFLRDKGRSGGVEPHDQVVLDGPVRRMHHPIWHYTYEDITDHVNTTNRFSSISACSMFEDGQRFKWSDFLIRPPWRFVRGFIFRSGWIDGRRGFIIAVVNAFGVAMKYAKLWELERAGGPAVEDHPAGPGNGTEQGGRPH